MADGLAVDDDLDGVIIRSVHLVADDLRDRLDLGLVVPRPQGKHDSRQLAEMLRGAGEVERSAPARDTDRGQPLVPFSPRLTSEPFVLGEPRRMKVGPALLEPLCVTRRQDVPDAVRARSHQHLAATERAPLGRLGEGRELGLAVGAGRAVVRSVLDRDVRLEQPVEAARRVRNGRPVEARDRHDARGVEAGRGPGCRWRVPGWPDGHLERDAAALSARRLAVAWRRRSAEQPLQQVHLPPPLPRGVTLTAQEGRGNPPFGVRRGESGGHRSPDALHGRHRWTAEGWRRDLGQAATASAPSESRATSGSASARGSTTAADCTRRWTDGPTSQTFTFMPAWTLPCRSQKATKVAD